VNILGIKVLLKLKVAEFVAALKLTVIIKLLLDSIIGEVHVSVGNILQCEFLATGSHVTLIVPISLQVAIYGAHEREHSDVELSILVQQGLLDVLLDDVAPLAPVNYGVANQSLDVVELLAHLNAAPSIGVLAGLDDPQLLAELVQGIQDR
jgi:hypothetical protein